MLEKDLPALSPANTSELLMKCVATSVAVWGYDLSFMNVGRAFAGGGLLLGQRHQGHIGLVQRPLWFKLVSISNM